MIETVKRTLYAGIGAAVITKDAVDYALREWVDKGKITPDEARRFSEKLVHAGHSRWDETRDAFAGRIEEVLGSAHLATRSRLESLETRVAELERRLGAVEPPSGAVGEPPSGETGE